MLKLFYSPDQYKLADRLIETLDENPPENILSPEVFVVQNHGMRQWLSHYMAGKKGVAANLKFEFPSECIWNLLRIMDPEIPDNLPSDRQAMVWSLMELLEDPDTLDDFEVLYHYIKSADADRRKTRMWKLSSKIADVFDQYLIYRPAMITGWENGELQNPVDAAERWQAKLWRKLLRHWKQYVDESWLHRAQQQKKLLTQIGKGNFNQSRLPKRLTVFSVSSMPTVFIEILSVLSECIDIQFYQSWISKDKYIHEQYKNPLLQSLNKHEEKYRRSFYSIVNKEGTRINRKYLPTEQTDEDILISTLQSDLQHDRQPANWKNEIAHSVQVHSCHSPRREIEVLYDQLLYLLDQDPSLSPDEILIMTPDIETYAPNIDAIFGHPDNGRPPLPYSIDRASETTTAVVFATFLELLELADSRFKVTDIIDLIDSEPLRQAYSFKDEDIERITQWISENNIKWGIDEEFKKNIDLPATKQFTWKSGMDRMMAGYAMKADNDKLFNGIYPYKEIEGKEAGERMGRFYQLLQSLFKTRKMAEHSYAPQDWANQLNNILDLYFDDEVHYRPVFHIRNAINQMVEDIKLGGYKSDISIAVVRRELQERLEEQSLGGGRLGSGITFSSLDPMRSLPFKYVGMIGMNEGVFPRSNIPIEFDLMHLHPNAGDPNQSEEDRYLFLENIQSAKKGLYFSYVGQSNQQDSSFPPSVVLSEFLDHLDAAYDIQAENIITEHPLQAFSNRYFDDSGLFSYSQRQLEISKNMNITVSKEESLISKPLPEAEDEYQVLSIDEFISFFQHPSKYYFQHRLGVRYREDEVITENREPFELKKLNKYYVEQELLDRYLDKQPLESVRAVMEAQNVLPEGWSGAQDFEQKSDEVREFGNEILEKQEVSQPDQDIRLELNQFKLSGSLHNIYQRARMDYRFGKARAKDKMAWWLRHLLFQQAKPPEHPGNSMFFSWDDSTFKTYNLKPVEDSESILKKMLDLYWKGLHQPLPYYSRSSYAFAENLLKKYKSEEYSLTKAEKKWETTKYSYGEDQDIYYRLTAGRDPFTNPEFKQLSLNIWEPYFEALNN